MTREQVINGSKMLSIILFVLAFSSCKKPSFSGPLFSFPTPTSGGGFPSEGLDYVQLTQGKYLIYKDSAGGVVDSVVVTKSILESPGGALKFSLVLTEVEGTSSMVWFSGNANDGSELKLSEWYSSGTGVDLLNPSAFFYSTQNTMQMIPSLTIEGKNYINVIVGEYESLLDSNDPGYTKRTFYWAKGIGIIKRRIVSAGGKIKTHDLIRNN